MKNNLLVCGGMPRSGTTFLHTAISNYSNVFSSRFKESYLFERSDLFLDIKLRMLPDDRIFLDFTPEYIFNRQALEKILNRKIHSFFILRNYEDYRKSLERYLSINEISNNFLLNMPETTFHDAISFARDNFFTIDFNDLKEDPDKVIRSIQDHFQLDFGEKSSALEQKNASTDRIYHSLNTIYNYLHTPLNFTKSALFGLV